MYSRRHFAGLALGAVSGAFAAGPDSKINGVLIGAQSYSFRDRPLDDAIKGYTAVGLGSCELWQGHVEPKVGRGKEDRAKLREWRTSAAAIDECRKVREKFKAAGVDLYGFNYSFRDDMTDEEMDRGFVFAKAMGVKCITASSTLSTAKRLVPFAAKHKIPVGMHNHSNLEDLNEFAKPESFQQAMALSPWFRVNLDIGHFVAAGYDPVKYISENSSKIVCLHIKDRKRNQGANVVFGEGDTPIKDVLQLLRDKKYRIPANIEYEYKGQDAVEEVRKCYAYCRKVLA